MRGEPFVNFDRAFFVGPQQQVMITPAWSLRLSDVAGPDTASDSADLNHAQSLAHPELFVKPDDWFEVNEVSDRCPDIVEELRALLAELLKSCQSGEPAVLSTLPAELVHGSE